MELVTLLEALDKTPSRNRMLAGFGVALGETPTPTTRIGVVKEIAHNPLVHVFLLETTMQWTSLWSVKPLQTKKKRNIAALADASIAGSKVTLHATVPANPRVPVLSK